ncbi:hypothetical protein [Streptomyces nigrescens]|uniref:hypothetical protein n=1 Tax=Streptomyces nigrescens TaxID=1920 RepID=UPI0036F7628D
MLLQQIHPNPAFDPCFRFDIDGRARFSHEGYLVDVQVRRPTAEDMPYCASAGHKSFDVVITGTVVLEQVVLCKVSANAVERDPYSMRGALEEVLCDVVEGARRKVAALAARAMEIDVAHKEGQT